MTPLAHLGLLALLLVIGCDERQPMIRYQDGPIAPEVRRAEPPLPPPMELVEPIELVPKVGTVQ